VLQGALIGVIGAAAGCAGGYTLTAVMSRFVRAEDGTALFAAQVDGTLYLLTVTGAALLGLAAAIMPARRAARLDPAQAIRL
jgi:lipoprotein-releasing system permease protein